MSNYLEVIKEFEGIIGAIIGVVATLITTHILKNMGELNLYLKEWNVENEIQDESLFDSYVKTTSLDNIKSLYISLNVEVYNSSDIPKIMRNIRIGFYNNKRELYIAIPDDKDNEIKGQRFNFPQKANIINIEPKKCIIKELSFNINDSDVINLLKTTKEVYFLYTNGKNKDKKVLIRKNVISV